MEILQRPGVQLSEGMQSLGIMGAQLRATLERLQTSQQYCTEGFAAASDWRERSALVQMLAGLERTSPTLSESAISQGRAVTIYTQANTFLSSNANLM